MLFEALFQSDREPQAASRLESYSSSDLEPPTWLTGGEMPNASGVVVNEESALCYSAVFNALTILGEGLGSLPLVLYRRLLPGKERATNLSLYSVLHDEPNPEMTSMVFREAMMVACLTTGDAYAEIEFDGRGGVRHLWFLNPYVLQPERKDGRIIYRYPMNETSLDPASGRRASRRKGRDWFESHEIFHIPGLSREGLVGIRRIRKAAQSLGLAMAAETFGASYFGNGASFKGYFTRPIGAPAMGDPAKGVFEEEHEKYSQGPYRAHRSRVLDEGMQYIRISDNPENAQALETRKYQVRDVARWFNVPASRLQEDSKANYNTLEMQEKQWWVSSLRPWAVKWEQEISRKLTPRLKRHLFFAEHLFDAIQRATYKERMEGYQTAIAAGIMSPDEARERENLPPIDGGWGRYHQMPLNYRLLGGPDPAEDVEATLHRSKTFAAAIAPLFAGVLAKADKRAANKIEAKASKLSAAELDEWICGDLKSEQEAFLRAELGPLAGAVASLLQVDADLAKAWTIENVATLSGAFALGSAPVVVLDLEQSAAKGARLAEDCVSVLTQGGKE